MKFFLKLYLLFSLSTFWLYAEREKVDATLVISGGVSLGAYEAGYNWALIKGMSKLKESSATIDPNLSAVSGASAGSINALLSAMYWCQKDSIPLRTHVDDNLFYETWVKLGIEDLVVRDKDPENKNALFTQKGLEKKGDKIIHHLKQPIFKKDCKVPLGIAVTKVTPIVETISGIDIKNQNFSVPLTFREKNGRGIVENRVMPPSKDFYISIPGIEKDRKKIINLLLASGAFPGAFQQVKLHYRYKGKEYSHYFIDGGLYDNVPLDLAIALDSNTSRYFFIDPSKMRKEPVNTEEESEELMPIGFITPNLMPIFSSFDIMQSMKLYQAINDNFRDKNDKILSISSRYHPIAGKFLAHFGSFLDENFRIYDYNVGVYDAIYRIAASFKKLNDHKYSGKSQIEMMNHVKTILGLDDNPESLAAYNLLLNTEFYHTKPKTTDRFSAIYNAFDLNKSDEKRYDIEEFKQFITKLDMRYLKETESSFLSYAKDDINSWYKKPLRHIINRIATLENERSEAGLEGAFPVETSIAAWSTTSLYKEKHGFEFLPLNVPQDEDKKSLHTVLKLLPGEIATDIKNGGLSIGYRALYYPQDKDLVSGFEGKLSYVSIYDQHDFVRGDIDIFKEYDDFIKFGVGPSFFGNMKGSFYQQDNAYGLNTYVDVMDIFRMTYVWRDGNLDTNHYIYFGIENIPSLIYWLNR